jgi:gelsolin
MSGLVKPKKYDWKDSNMALFGSDVEKKVKGDAAKIEPAWIGAGQKVGLQIWRIVSFKVTHWPKEDYGKFFSGDSYIILNTYNPKPNGDELAYDVHFWIGSQSTQDEYGTAAYKTVELDIYLGDKPVQHREVQGHESNLFKSYFKKGIMIMEGGAESGFRHVEPAKYRPRLLHFCGDKKNVVIMEVPRRRSILDSTDVYLLDLGMMIYQWNGTGSNKNERFKAMMALCSMKSERGNARSETLDEDFMSSCHPFYKTLDASGAVEDGEEEEEEKQRQNAKLQKETKRLFRVSDATGSLTFSKVKEDNIRKTDFDSGDVFILDTAKECFVWIGSGASPQERQNGMAYAHNHLKTTSHPLIPVVIVKEGQQNKDFTAAIAA